MSESFRGRRPTLNETAQKATDATRLLRAGLRRQDSETVDVAYKRIAKLTGPDLAWEFTARIITAEMDKGFRFIDEETGKPLPLFSHQLPEI